MNGISNQPSFGMNFKIMGAKALNFPVEHFDPTRLTLMDIVEFEKAGEIRQAMPFSGSKLVRNAQDSLHQYFTDKAGDDTFVLSMQFLKDKAICVLDWFKNPTEALAFEKVSANKSTPHWKVEFANDEEKAMYLAAEKDYKVGRNQANYRTFEVSISQSEKSLDAQLASKVAANADEILHSKSAGIISPKQPPKGMKEISYQRMLSSLTPDERRQMKVGLLKNLESN